MPPTSRFLTVILGAGASYDSLPPNVSSALFQGKLRPPLTAEIFHGRAGFQPILEKYPKALTLASTIRIRVTRGEALESVLRSLSNSKEEHIVRQFRQIPLYLQELFGEISVNYTKQPINYHHLVNSILGSQFERVAFVTLNYDLLLDNSLETISNRPMNDIGAYIQPDQRWTLVKLHGSVNWARSLRRVTVQSVPPASLGEMLAVVDKVSITEDDLGPVTLLNSHQQRRIASRFLYPALVVPVEGKYGFVCPRSHIDALKRHLSACPNFLVIGVSGRDQDLLDLMGESISECRGFATVGGGDIKEVTNRFVSGVPRLQSAGMSMHKDGFSHFILSGELEKFLEQVKKN